MTPALSVVIPTRDRCAVLRDTLAAVDRSEGVDGQVEVVVVDDGSTDDTQQWLEGATLERASLVRLSQPPSGPAAARNRGVAAASAERVLFLGDDTLPLPGTLAAHVAAAAGREVAVQGRIDWDPEQEITPVMDFLAPAGPQFYFAGLDDGQPVDWTIVLASNMSAPAGWLREEPFDERFPIAGFEDTELAYRWARRGWGAVYSERARCWHRHRYDELEPFLERQRRVGRLARLGAARHPGMLPRTVLQPAAVGLAFLARHLLRTVTGRRREADLWDLRCRWSFLRGVLLG
jgi:glycosyltransferase involved in cell wall biosynthesis